MKQFKEKNGMVYYQCFKHVFRTISACIFYVLWIYTQGMWVGKWEYCLVKKKKLPTYLPYFSVARYANTIFFFAL